MLTAEGYFEMAVNSEWREQALDGRWYRKYSSYEDFLFLQIFEIWWRFHKWNNKPRKRFLFLRLLDLKRERQILNIWNSILVMGTPCVNKQPYDLKLQSGRYFLNYFSLQWWRNMVKVPSWRFSWCLEPFNMLTVEGCFETALNSEWRDQALDGG